MMERPLWQRILVRIWPTIRKAVNDLLFLLEKVFRALINGAKKQIRP